MELITKTTAVRLQSHLAKYLVADEDRTTVRQSSNAFTLHSIWIVEPSGGGAAARFKNCGTGLYLATSNSPFLLGVTGKRVVQAARCSAADWAPVRDGFQIKLKADGKFLRANGGTPPWRNSVTHDVPVSGATSDWTLWDVEPVELPAWLAEGGSRVSSMWSLTSSEGSSDDGGDSESPPASPVGFRRWPRLSMNKLAMDYFIDAKVVRLRSRHGKYLAAAGDRLSVTQDTNGSSANARWFVEVIHSNPSAADDRPSLLRLRSRHGTYLTATDEPHLLGVTGRRVLQTLPDRPDSATEWEPSRASGKHAVKLRARHGSFLRANGGVPPWRNSVTHDLPTHLATQDWVLWEVEILEFRPESVEAGPAATEASPFSDFPAGPAATEVGPFADFPCFPPKPSERTIYYHIADEDGSLDETKKGRRLVFKGDTIEDLTRTLKEETGISKMLLCTKNPLNGELYPLMLRLPPNTFSMNVVVVPRTL